MPVNIVATQDLMRQMFAALRVTVDREKQELESAITRLEKNDRDKTRLMSMPEGSRWRGLASRELQILSDGLDFIEKAESSEAEDGTPILVLMTRDPE